MCSSIAPVQHMLKAAADRCQGDAQRAEYQGGSGTKPRDAEPFRRRRETTTGINWWACELQEIPPSAKRYDGNGRVYRGMVGQVQG